MRSGAYVFLLPLTSIQQSGVYSSTWSLSSGMWNARWTNPT